MIGLYNLEPYSNIALEKIRMYYEQQGKRVVDYLPLQHIRYDQIYCSSIFTFSDKSYVKDNMICGGSGFDLKTTLPTEIEEMKPKINIGFTTRGCIRNCPFCVVPQKEGKIRILGDIYDFWDRESWSITILDNNILALLGHFIEICQQIKDNSLAVDFNQGLDARLITDEIAYYLTTIRYSQQVRISWDLMKDEKQIKEGIGNLLKYFNPHRIMCYVLVGFNTTEQEDLYRVEYLKSLDIDPFAMPYNKNPLCKDFVRWCNRKEICQSVAWGDYKK
jgi:hypothetical protein